MARKHFGHYHDFLVSVLNFWSQLGPNFSAGEWDEAHIEAEKEAFAQLNRRIADLEIDLGYLRTEREGKCKQFESFNSRLRGGIIAAFGVESDQLKLMPRLLKATATRPNKSAATRKANTLKRKATEALAASQPVAAPLPATEAATFAPSSLVDTLPSQMSVDASQRGVADVEATQLAGSGVDAGRGVASSSEAPRPDAPGDVARGVSGHKPWPRIGR